MKVSRTENEAYSSYMKIEGSKAKLNIITESNKLQIENKEGIQDLLKEDFHAKHQNALNQLIKSFAKAIRESGKSPVKLADAKVATQVSVALSKSLALNEIVNINLL